MKKQVISNSTKASFVRFGIAVLLFMNMTQASANPLPKSDDPFLSVKYVGLVEDRSQFQLDFVNDNEEAYLLQIMEQDGTIIYKEKIDRRTFTKRFEWNNMDINSSKLVFTVTGIKSKKAQTFEVNKVVRTVQDVVVSKL